MHPHRRRSDPTFAQVEVAQFQTSQKLVVVAITFSVPVRIPRLSLDPTANKRYLSLSRELREQSTKGTWKPRARHTLDSFSWIRIYHPTMASSTTTESAAAGSQPVIGIIGMGDVSPLYGTTHLLDASSASYW
jgi:hypothetical protein